MSPDRRTFLLALPVAAGVTVADLLPAMAAAQNAMPLATQNAMPLSEGSYQFISAEQLADEIRALEATPGTKRLFNDKNFLFDLWVEKAKSAKEFEWHERRDHIVQILEGSTLYEVGGTPKNPHSTGPGEWLAPAVDGATKLTLKKGDTLVIRRGTPHKRTTAESVVLTLAAPLTPMSG